jgi:hypothetical protein
MDSKELYGAMEYGLRGSGSKIRFKTLIMVGAEGFEPFFSPHTKTHISVI